MLLVVGEFVSGQDGICRTTPKLPLIVHGGHILRRRQIRLGQNRGGKRRIVDELFEIFGMVWTGFPAILVRNGVSSRQVQGKNQAQ